MPEIDMLNLRVSAHQPRIYVVALNYQHFDYWCRMVADPPQSPNGSNVIFLGTSNSDAGYRLRGRRITDEDLVVKYGPWYEGKYTADVLEAIDDAKERSR